MGVKPENRPRYRENRPRPSSDLGRSYGNIALNSDGYNLTEHDAQFAAYAGNPLVQADISNAEYEHSTQTVDRPE
jgi:hypothetical protein